MIQTETPYPNAAISGEASVLTDIHLASKNIAIYQRDILSLSQELEQMAAQDIQCRASGTMPEVEAGLVAYFSANQLEYPALLADITRLLRLFEQTTQATSFRLLLATVRTNMCRRFHTDINNIRMLCTYVGPATLWVPDEMVNRRAFQKGAENESIVLDEAQVQQVETGDVVLLKGALYPDANPIMHRSPSIEADGAQRLLLRIDMNESFNF